MERIDKDLFMKMIERAASNLALRKELINSLNVFPVPDGDTGTNLYLTLKSAVTAFSNSPPRNLKEALEVLSRETLYGARGNSGIILASFFEGFTSALEGPEELRAEEMKEGFQRGTEVAYKTILHPVEGTMLTAIKMASLGMQSEETNDILSLLRVAYEGAKKATDESPELLPVLKDAGVVDAGAEGFVTILEGFLAGLLERELPLLPERHLTVPRAYTERAHHPEGKYCLEFIVLGDLEVQSLQKKLRKMGGSIGILKRAGSSHVHIHTDIPEEVISFASSLGGVEEVKRDLLPTLSENRIGKKKGMKILAVAPGEGFIGLMRELGADQVLVTPRGAKPSVKDLEEAVKEFRAQKVVVLPNDGDTIPVALELKNLFPDMVDVIPSTTVPEGIMALLTLNEEGELKVREVEEAMKETRSGKVTHAVREGRNASITYRRGDFVGISGKRILAVSSDPTSCLIELLERLDAKKSSLVHIFYGEPFGRENLEKLERMLKDAFFDLEIQVYPGGQPIYHFLVGVYP